MKLATKPKQRPVIVRPEVAPVDIGIALADRSAIAGGLSRLLADTFSLYLETHNFHWNVTGPQFQALHLMFEAQYQELWAATDVIAERIRALGHPVPATFSDFMRLSSVPDAPAGLPAMAMVGQLAQGHEAVARTARGLFPRAQEAHDEATVDMLTQRLQVHEKAVWMLRATLE